MSLSLEVARGGKGQRSQKEKKLQPTHRHDRRNASVVSCSSLILKSTSSIIGPQLFFIRTERERGIEEARGRERVRARGRRKKGRLARRRRRRRRHHQRALEGTKTQSNAPLPLLFSSPVLIESPNDINGGVGTCKRGLQRGRKARHKRADVDDVEEEAPHRPSSLSLSSSSSAPLFLAALVFLYVPVDVHLVALVRGLVLPVGVPPVLNGKKERERAGREAS